MGLADARVGDGDRVAVEVADGAREAEESLAEGEAQHHREVGALALEDAVRRGLELQVHVARHHARRLLRRALEADRRAW